MDTERFYRRLFAAEEAINLETKQDEKLAVWAFYYPAMGSLHQIERWSEPVIVVTAPSASNPNLQAQQGAFTKVGFINVGIEELDGMSLDEVLTTAATTGNQNAQSSKMFRFTLPQQEAPKLLWHLSKLDITASTVFPGYSGVAGELRQQPIWVSDS